MDSLEPAVQVALITTGGALITAFLGFVTKFAHDASKHAKKANEQVSNTHETNLRDDIDELHDDVRLVLKLQAATQQGLTDLRGDHRALEKRVEDHLSKETE